MSAFSIDPGVGSRYPGTRAGVFFLEGLRITRTDPVVEQLKANAATTLRERFHTTEALVEDPAIIAWHAFYREMHLDPGQVLPAQESLARRLLAGAPFPKISTLVDICNVTACRFLLPVGAFDLDRISGDIVLRLAHKGERMIPLGGTKPKGVPQNEVVYADEVQVFSRYTKDAESTKVTLDTHRSLVVIDLAPGQPDGLLDTAGQAVADLLASCFHLDRPQFTRYAA